MKTYNVTSVIQSKDKSNPPVEIRWYNGASQPVAMTAMAQAATSDADDGIAGNYYYDVVSVTMTVSDDE